MKPSISRDVHYVAETDGKHYAAVVTHVHEDGGVDLYVFPTLTVPLQNHNVQGPVYEDPTGRGMGTWHWPEQV